MPLYLIILSRMVWMKEIIHQAHSDKTPKEVFIGIKHDVVHFRIFGFPMYFYMPKVKRNKVERTGKKGRFVGYCENYKYFRIYFPSQRNIKFNRDINLDEDVSLGKERDIPPPPPIENDDDKMDLLEGPFIPELKKDVIDDPMEPMDPLDPPPYDPPTKKRLIWLHDT